MIIQSDDSSVLYQIQRYEPGSIWVNKQCYHCSIIIQPNILLAPWRPKTLSEVESSDFVTLFENKVDIVIIGTGSKLIIPSQTLLLPLFEKGMGVEFMDSRAACHTYTVLAGELRNVAACILIDT